MSAHALLSASGAKRWLTCTPSAVLEAGFPEHGSVYTEEGTLAHRLAELKIKKHYTLMKPSEYKKELAAIQGHYLFKPEMMDYVDAYVDFVKAAVKEAKTTCEDTKIYQERLLDFSEYVPEGFGTGDVIIIADGRIQVIDLKYGKGVAVEAENNPQTRLYGVGALLEFWPLYDITQVAMTIYQPRLNAVSTEEMTADALIAWAETEVKPRAELAAKGEGTFVVGDHCRWCRARAACRARADTALADFAEPAVEELPAPATLTVEEIGHILPRIVELTKWGGEVQKYALFLATQGSKIPGHKLVEGRSNRVIRDEAALAAKLLAAGYTQQQVYAPVQVLGLTALEKKENIGKADLARLAGDLIVKPDGKPVLVEDKDTRPELSSLESAQSDFALDAEPED